MKDGGLNREEDYGSKKKPYPFYQFLFKINYFPNKIQYAVMDILTIKATPKSLNVICENGLLEFRGCSITNDPKVFFKPIQNWINNYLKDPPEDTLINMEFDYIDTASLKYVFEILKSLEKIIDRQKSVQLNWHYDETDHEILELGEILSAKIKIPFNFIKY